MTRLGRQWGLLGYFLEWLIINTLPLLGIYVMGWCLHIESVQYQMAQVTMAFGITFPPHLADYPFIALAIMLLFPIYLASIAISHRLHNGEEREG